MKQKLRYIFFLFLCCSTFLNAQTQNDSLAKYSYEELHAFIDSTKHDKQELSKIYTSEYLERAKLDTDTIKIARGYFYKSFFEEGTVAIAYIDSTINISKNQRHYLYPALGYRNKGVYLYEIHRYEEALNNFLEALKVLKTNKNIGLEISVRSAINSIKSNWMSINEETLKFTLENYFFIKNQRNYKTKFYLDYIAVLHSLSIQYMENEKYDKGIKIAKEGIKETLKHGDAIEYIDFVSDIGAFKYYMKDYNSCIDSMLKAINIKERKNIDTSMEHYFLGKSFNKLKQPEKAHHYFLRVDSIYQLDRVIFPEMRITYEHIIDYYKSKNDVENQIKYYDRLIEADAKIDSTYKYVTETVQKKYETPQIIAERNRLLEEAKEKENAWKYNFGIISALLVAILGILVFVFRRQKYYKKRFEEVMSKKDLSTALKVTNQENELQKKDIDVPETTVEDILKGLSKFEASKGFTKQISLTDLAKKLGTNQKYLSKVINWHYEKGYSAYINELRVHYAISKLKEETTFRNYTIKAIAEEVGFGNAAAFAKAFSKTTGINPSYFIKELQKR